MIRTFSAVFPSSEAREALGRFVDRGRTLLPEVRWVVPENLHFTLRFFGDLDAGQRAAAARVLEETAPAAISFPVGLGTLGVFPRWSRPRVLWWGAARGEARLNALAKVLEEGWVQAGLGAADKPFKAHLTMGRWKGPGRVAASTREQLSRELPRVTFAVSEVCLVGSALGRGGSRYDVLHRVGLKKSD